MCVHQACVFPPRVALRLYLFSLAFGVVLTLQVVHWTSVCGNGIVEGEEECDDGSGQDGNGCSASCKVDLHS